jgi:hypothetical protein
VPARKTVLRLVPRNEPAAERPAGEERPQLAFRQPPPPVDPAPPVPAPAAPMQPDPFRDDPVDGGGNQPDESGFNRAPSAADLKRWFKPFDAVGVNIQKDRGQLPFDASRRLFLDHVGPPARLDWAAFEYHWAAAEMWHQPLYFDDVPLEVYGQTISPEYQPYLSGLRFYATLPAMPLKLWADRPYSYISALGRYRPGSHMPQIRQRPEWPPGEGPLPIRGGWGVWNRHPWPGPGPSPGVIPWDVP